LDNEGNPIDKAIPILKLSLDGTIDFVELASPALDGLPFQPSRVRPAG
jgi:hypothetical protein